MTALPVSSAQPVTSVAPVQRVMIAERALIGQLLKSGSRGKAQGDFERVSDLKFSDFEQPQHGLIFHAMKEIAARHENISIITVETELNKTLKDGTGRAIDKVGQAYLYGLLDGRYGDVTDSARIIRKASWRRRVKAKARELDKLADSEAMDETAIMESVVAISDDLGKQAAALTGRTGITLRESVGQFWTRIEIQSQTGEVNYGIMTGLKAMDDLTKGFQRKKLYVVAGPSGKGKSALGIKIALESMRRGARVGFIPLEMSHEEMTSRLMAIESRIDGSWLQSGNVPKEHLPRLAEACRRIQGYQESEQFWYLDFSPASATASVSLPTINDIRVKLAQHMTLYGADILIIDQVSIEAMEGTRPNMDEKKTLLQIITGLKKLAEYYNIPIVVMAQVNRAGDSDDGTRPSLKHLANSSSMGNTPDLVLFIYRSATERMTVEPVELIVAKHRGGPTGIGLANFIPAFTDFQDRDS
jgi:replicative DNA helicase